MSRYAKKEDKPFELSDSHVIVEYQKDGQLYVVDNPQNITLTFDDYVVVTRSYESEEDSKKQMPYTVCRVVGFTNKEFLEVAKFMKLAIDVKQISMKYHEEVIVKNISRDDNDGQGSMVMSEGGKSSSEEGLGKISQAQEDNPQNDKPEDDKLQDDKSQEDKSKGKGYNDSSDIWDNIPAKKKEDKKPVLDVEAIFSFIKKTH